MCECPSTQQYRPTLCMLASSSCAGVLSIMDISRRCGIIIHFARLTSACKLWCPLLPGYGCLLLLVYDRLSLPFHVGIISTPSLPSKQPLLLLHLSCVEMHNRWTVGDHGVSSIRRCYRNTAQGGVLAEHGRRHGRVRLAVSHRRWQSIVRPLAVIEKESRMIQEGSRTV